MALIIVFYVLLIGAAVAAFLAGGREERFAAMVIVFAAFGTLIADRAVEGAFVRPETGIAVLDTALFIVLGTIMITSTKFWPIWATGFHAVTVLTHLAAVIDPQIRSGAYGYYAAWWSVPVLLSLLLGCFEHRRVMISQSLQPAEVR